jgi:Calcium-dependent channel, 7TM region, putative phosphate/Cytosolic domain of 10TM putative phosphate transporter
MLLCLSSSTTCFQAALVCKTCLSLSLQHAAFQYIFLTTANIRSSVFSPVAAQVVRNAGNLLKLKNKHIAAYTNFEAACVNPRAGSVKEDGQKVPAADHWRKKLKELFDEASYIDEHLDEKGGAEPTNAALVIFVSKRDASIAAQVNCSPTSSAWKVFRAPEPQDLHWNKLDIMRRTAFIRYTLTAAAISTGIIFFYIPVTVIQALNSFQSLAKIDGLGFLADFDQSSPNFVNFLESFVPPLLLFVLNALVPVLVRLAMIFRRFHSKSDMDLAVQRALFAFGFASTFLGNTLSGTIFKSLKTFLDDPSFNTIIELYVCALLIVLLQTGFCQPTLNPI